MRRFARRMLCMLLTVFLLAGALTAFSESAGWQSAEDGRRWYREADGSWPAKQWKQIDKKWYYFDANGYVLTGWQMLDGKWYYLGEDGARRTRWQQVGDYWYYLGSDGVMQTGWIEVSGSRYYLKENGAMQTGWTMLNGSWYYLGESGAMQTGWIQVDGEQYFLREDGTMQTGWIQRGNSWYYLKSNGAMAIGLQTIGGKTYYLGNDGARVSGLETVNGATYCFGSDGAALTGQQQLEGATFLFGEDGVLTCLSGDYDSKSVNWDNLWSTVLEQEAWYVTDGNLLRAGNLNKIVHLWLDREGAADPSAEVTVWLCRNKTMTITQMQRGAISRFDFLADPDAISGGSSLEVSVSETAPGKTPGETSTDPTEKTTFYVWLESTSGGSGSGSGGGSGRSSGGSGRSSGGSYTATTHGRETEQTVAGYDQVSLAELTDETADASMSTLALSGTDLNLMLTRDGKAACFVPKLITWQPETTEEAPSERQLTLLLEACEDDAYLASNGMNMAPEDGAADELIAEPAQTEEKATDETAAVSELPVLEVLPEGAARWSLDGATLRTLNRSGVAYLALEADGCAVVLPTEGFLAGTAYDEMKSRGIPGRLFLMDVAISTRPTGLILAPQDESRILRDPDAPIRSGQVLLCVTVEEKTWLVTEDPTAELYQKNVLILPAAQIVPDEESETPAEG